MAESLRDLVVSLSLNTDNFTRNIKSVGKQIQEAESYFKLASAGIKDFENTPAGLSSKLEMLERKLKLQKDAVGQYERALAAANDKLTECYDRQNDYAQRLEIAKQRQADLRGELENATRAYQHYSETLGESDSATISAQENMDAAREEYELARQDVQRLSGQCDALRRSTQNAADAVSTGQTQLNRARAAVRDTQTAIRDTNAQLRTAQSVWTAAGKALNTFSERCKKVGDTAVKVGSKLTKVLTTPIATLGVSAVKASIDFESSFTSVRKTVDATEAEFTQLAETSKRMSTEIAASTDTINEVMATGGQLGIATEHLEEFTRVMIDLGNSCEDLSADEAATSIAKFANIMGTDQSMFSNIGSTIVDLGNNFATTEAPIMEMAQRLAGAGKQVGLTEAQILGFATALSSVGIEAQMGGSAFSKALIKMEVACATGGDALDDFASVCGLSSEQFKTMFESDPAAAFQAFIVGLAQMDEEGESAIAVLDEIGISEVRLRDTLLRSVNATELFANAQTMAEQAWEENSALSTEAGKRYGTTESKLTNLKNTALLFAQTVGDDLNPTVQKLIAGASELLEKLTGMDASQREQLIKWAAIAASIGPVILGFGKITKGIGTFTGMIGKFATAVGKAGGGFSGFISVLTKSPTVWIALAAGIAVGTYALVDFMSGAKAAREALEGMNETAQNWKDTAAETFYGNSEGLSFFGMSKSDFQEQASDAGGWLDGVLAAWTDGKRDTDEMVQGYIDSFKNATSSVRTELQELKETSDASGYGDMSEQIQADIDTLDAMDSEIETLLKKRQNGYLTDKEKIRLQELIDTREAIVVKYRLDSDNAEGFDTIARKVEAEVARAQARGQSDADVSVYENAMVAAAEGMASINSGIDEQYDKEYAVIQLIEDSTKRQQALDDLNARYNQQRREAALEYAELLSGVVMPVWEQEDIQQAKTQVGDLFTLLRKYSMAGETEKPAILTELQSLSSEMDEGTLTEYLGMLTQIQSLLDQGLTESEIGSMFPDMDISTALGQFAGLADYLDLIKTDLPGLYSMFDESLPEEVLKLTTDLDMTGAQARWDEFASDPGAITTDAVIGSITAAENAEAQQINVNAFISKYTETPEGADKSSLTPDGIIAYVNAYSEATTGTDVSALTPENVTAMVAAYRELASGTDVSMLKPDDITAYVMKYLEGNGIDTSALTPEAVTAFVMAYEEATGGASTNMLTPDGITAMVGRYLEADGVDISALSPEQIEAIVSAYAEATGCDKSELMTSFTVYVTEYKDAEGVTVPQPQTRVVITGYDYLGFKSFEDDNPELGLEIPVRLGELENGELERYIADGKLKVWQDGIEIPIESVPDGMLTADTIASLDADGTLHVIITPELSGSEEAIAELREEFEEVDQTGATAMGKAAGLVPTTALDMIENAMSRISKYKEGGFWNWLTGATDYGILDSSMKNDFDSESVAELSAYVGEIVTAIQTGAEVSEEDMANMQSILEFLNGLDETETGAHIKEGIAQGMTEAGWDSDAETVASDLEAALATAFDSHSPAQRMVPMGQNVSAGIGQGASAYGFSSDAAAVASALESALRAAMPVSTFSGIGLNAMNGLRAGILSGRAGVVAAMRQAARDAVNAAKSELKINSPSRVFRDEVGVMTMKGLGEGVLKESRAQAKVIQNAARYLTGEAKAGSITTTSNDNRKTYNSTSTVSFAGSNFYVNDKPDIKSLAIEIARLTKRRQVGKGLV